jgi:hypothetical protein
MKEALRYLNNAKEILKSAPIEDNAYSDVKPVQEACAAAYLAVLKVIDLCLLNRGLNKKDLPRSVDGYRKALQKHLSMHDGKLLREFERLYDQLHIAGYYRALLHDVDIVKDAIRAARTFIEKVNPVRKSSTFQQGGSHGALNPVFALKGIISSSPL